jgi:hypothetical protein
MPAKKETYWIPESVAQHKKGSLHKMLSIPCPVRIPFTLLQSIVDTTIGDVAKNPTHVGKPTYTVTKLMKARANWGLNLKRINRNYNNPKKAVPTVKAPTARSWKYK